MEYICIGKIITTHGLNGEIKIRSDFEKKHLCFIPDMKVYIGEDKLCLTINTYRRHQEYDMITFKEINDIDKVIPFKQQDIYIDKDDLKLNNEDYLLNDLINLDVYNDDILYGKVSDYENHNSNIILNIKKSDNGEVIVPLCERYIINVDKDNKRINATNLGELEI